MTTNSPTMTISKQHFLNFFIFPVLFLTVLLFQVPCKTENCFAATSATYFVSPKGNDSNNGSIDAPFKTITKARDTVRTINSKMQGDIIIYLRDGTHRLDNTLVLDWRDSGNNGYNIIYKNYQNETPIISGGKQIKGWIQEGNKWKASVGTSLDSRQLYVNGVRATRARSDTGMAITTKNKNATGYTINADTGMKDWGNIQNVELVGNNYWRQFRCGISDISGNIITVKKECWDDSQAQAPFTLNDVTWVENAYELLDSPGEWYLNKSTGWLYYIPRPGEDMNSAAVELPVLQTLISGGGALDNKLHNIKFQGLRFSYAGWTGPNGDRGFPEIQNAFYGRAMRGGKWEHKMPANVYFYNAESIVFDRNVFIHLGAVGLSFGSGSQNNTISGNYFYDISGNAVMVGDLDNPTAPDHRVRPINNKVTNNYIHNIAVEYQGCLAIFVGFTQRTLVAHNEIHNIPYIGIGIGKTNPSFSSDNYIKNNRIYDLMKILHDGGGIHSNGVQPGSVYSGNVITGQLHDFGAIYLDGKSEFIEVANNVVFDNKRSVLIKGGKAGGGNHFIHDNWWQDRGMIEDFRGKMRPDVWFLKQTVYVGGPDTIINNHVITSLSDAPSSIIENAGLEPAYDDIKNIQITPARPYVTSSPASPSTVKSSIKNHSQSVK